MVFWGYLAICQIPCDPTSDRNGPPGDWKVSLRERCKTPPEIDIHGPVNGPAPMPSSLAGTGSIYRFWLGATQGGPKKIDSYHLMCYVTLKKLLFRQYKRKITCA